MASATIAILVFLVIAVGLGLLLVTLIRREGPTERGLDWESAEEVARRDTDDGEAGDDREW